MKHNDTKDTVKWMSNQGIYLNLKIEKNAPNPPRSEMKTTSNLKGITNECELKT